MAIRYYKKTVECECGIDYGNCTNHNIFIEKEYSVTDTYALFVKRHSDSPESKFECLGYYEMNDLSALVEVITASDKMEDLTDEEFKELDK